VRHLHIHHSTHLQQLHLLPIRPTILLRNLLGFVFIDSQFRREIDEWTIAVIPFAAVQTGSDDFDGVGGIETEFLELVRYGFGGSGEVRLVSVVRGNEQSERDGRHSFSEVVGLLSTEMLISEQIVLGYTVARSDESEIVQLPINAYATALKRR
jgi:hypothetical protein